MASRAGRAPSPGGKAFALGGMRASPKGIGCSPGGIAGSLVETLDDPGAAPWRRTLQQAPLHPVTNCKRSDATTRGPTPAPSSSVTRARILRQYPRLAHPRRGRFGAAFRGGHPSAHPPGMPAPPAGGARASLTSVGAARRAGYREPCAGEEGYERFAEPRERGMSIARRRFALTPRGSSMTPLGTGTAPRGSAVARGGVPMSGSEATVARRAIAKMRRGAGGAGVAPKRATAALFGAAVAPIRYGGIPKEGDGCPVWVGGCT
jgi:hypothetical protein